MAIDKGPQVVFGSEKRALLISTDIRLLSSYVGAIKVSDASYKLICCSRVSGLLITISPFAIFISIAVNVAVGEGSGVGVKVSVGVFVIVAVAVGVYVEVGRKVGVKIEMGVAPWTPNNEFPPDTLNCGTKKKTIKKRLAINAPIPNP